MQYKGEIKKPKTIRNYISFPSNISTDSKEIKGSPPLSQLISNFEISNKTEDELFSILQKINWNLIYCSDYENQNDSEKIFLPINEIIFLIISPDVSLRNKIECIDILYHSILHGSIESHPEIYENIFKEQFLEALLNNLNDMQSKLKESTLKLIGNIILESQISLEFYVNHGILNIIEQNLFSTSGSFAFQCSLRYLPIDFIDFINHQIQKLLTFTSDEIIHCTGMNCLFILFQRQDIQYEAIDLTTFYNVVRTFLSPTNPKRLTKALKVCKYLMTPPNILDKLIEFAQYEFYDYKWHIHTFACLVHFSEFWRGKIPNQTIIDLIDIIKTHIFEVKEIGIFFVEKYYIIDENLENNEIVFDLYTDSLMCDGDLQIICLKGMIEIVQFYLTKFGDLSTLQQKLDDVYDPVVNITTTEDAPENVIELCNHYLSLLSGEN